MTTKEAVIIGLVIGITIGWAFTMSYHYYDRENELTVDQVSQAISEWKQKHLYER